MARPGSPQPLKYPEETNGEAGRLDVCTPKGKCQAEERRRPMDCAEFTEMHANCVTAMRTYFVQVEKTSAMLAECTAEPLTLRERFKLMSQGIVEKDAHLAYFGRQKSSP